MGHEYIRIKVRQLRDTQGWSADQLGKKAGYTNGTMINQIENGGKLPSAQKLARIAEALGVSVSELYGDTAPCGVTNHANGDHAIGYQHNEGAALMTDELREVVRQVVREEWTVQREQLMQDFRVVLREAAREAEDDANEGES